MDPQIFQIISIYVIIMKLVLKLTKCFKSHIIDCRLSFTQYEVWIWYKLIYMYHEIITKTVMKLIDETFTIHITKTSFGQKLTKF